MSNLLAIKVRILPPTNTLGTRLRFTQLNSSESVLVGFDYSYELIEHIKRLIRRKCSLVVDNTQTNYMLFVVDFEGKSFPNIINEIKESLK